MLDFNKKIGKRIKIKNIWKTMKDKIISIILLVSLFAIFTVNQVYANSSESSEKTEISVILEEKKEILPDTFALGLEIIAIMDTEVKAINIIGSVDKTLRDLGFDYKGGKYWVYQNCWWEKNKRKCSGYKAIVEYLFLLKNPSFQNKILKILEKFKQKYRGSFKFKIYRTDWIVSEKKMDRLKDELRLKIIKKAKDFLIKVSSALGKSCDIKSIDYNVGLHYPSYLPTKSKGLEAPEPKKEEKTVNIKAKVILICK